LGGWGGDNLWVGGGGQRKLGRRSRINFFKKKRGVSQQHTACWVKLEERCRPGVEKTAKGVVGKGQASRKGFKRKTHQLIYGINSPTKQLISGRREVGKKGV